MAFAWLRNSVSLTALFAASAAFAGEDTTVAANTTPANPESNIFDLGQIEQVTITGSPLSEAINESTISNDETFKFNALTVDRALDLVPGANSSTTGGPRNDRLYYVRGFDRFQSPLYVDGIRVY